MAASGAASRESVAAAGRALDQLIDRSSPSDLASLAAQLTQVTALLDREGGFRRALADSSAEPDRRQALFDRVLGRQLDARTADLLRPLVRERWSSARDLSDAVELLSRRAALGVAERDGSLDDVEDQLFRFGRILEAEPRLRQTLEDRTMPVQGRIDLLDRLVGDRVDPTTRTLLEQAVTAPRGQHLERTVTELVELAAARRERYVAYVTAPAPLTEEQERRLSAALARIYGRQVSVQVGVDPELLGGLVVKVNDEIIDGSVLSRLQGLRHRLAG
ncbi:MAG TPA: F0F1 ATP synthase subunit delta [Mycobacteriales bacterium]